MPITKRRNDEYLRNRLMILYEENETKYREQLISSLTDKFSYGSTNISADFPESNSFFMPEDASPVIFGTNNNKLNQMVMSDQMVSLAALISEVRALFILADLAMAHCECFGITRSLITSTENLPVHFVAGVRPAIPFSYDNVLLRSLSLLHTWIHKEGINGLKSYYKYESDFQPLYDLLSIRGSDYEYRFDDGFYHLLEPLQLRDSPLSNARNIDLWIVKSGVPPLNKTTRTDNIPLARIRSLMSFEHDNFKPNTRSVTDWIDVRGPRGAEESAFGPKERENANKKRPDTVAEIFNFNSHLQNSEEWMLRILVRRYKPYTDGEAAMAFDDLPTFCNHTYFPIVIQSDGGDMYAAFIPCVYSNFPLQENILRHSSNYISVQVPNSTTSVMVDFGCISENDVNAVKAIASALLHSNPKQMSYISFCSSIRITGASMGLAVAMAICGCPFVAATGYIASMDVTLKDDIIGHIELLDTKVKLAQRENWPIVCSQSDLIPVISKSPVVNASNMFTSAMMNNANRFNKIVPGKHVLLACTSLSEAIDMSVLYFKARDNLRMAESAMLQASATSIAKAQVGQSDIVGKASNAAGLFREKTQPDKVDNKPKRRRK